MRFIERIILGLRYHRKLHIKIIIVTLLFTVLGLFLQTNIMLENQAQKTFTARIFRLTVPETRAQGQTGQISGKGDMGTKALPGKTISPVTRHAITKHINQIYQRQTNFYSTAFMIIVAAFTICIMTIIINFARGNHSETRALMLMGRRSSGIAAQNSLEYLTSFGVTFSIVAMPFLLFVSPILKLIEQLNRTVFLHALTSTADKSVASIEVSLAKLLHNHITDFTSSSLLIGHDFGSSKITPSISGFTIIFMLGTCIILFVSFITTLISARSIRKSF